MPKLLLKSTINFGKEKIQRGKRTNSNFPLLFTTESPKVSLPLLAPRAHGSLACDPRCGQCSDMALKRVLVMGPGQSCLLTATIASQMAMEGLKERVPNYKLPRAPYGHIPVALSPSGCQTFNDEARIFEPFFPILPLYLCCALSTPLLCSLYTSAVLPLHPRVCLLDLPSPSPDLRGSQKAW